MGHEAKRGSVLERFTNDLKRFRAISSDFQTSFGDFQAIFKRFQAILKRFSIDFKRFEANLAAALGNQARPYVVSYGLAAEMVDSFLTSRFLNPAP